MVEGGIYTGVNPLTDPIAIFLLQLIVIIGFTRGLARAFRFLRQPLVIWEIIGGICLGPSLLGNIPGFSSAIFPKSSLSTLNIIATIGLVLYLFLMGMELDIKEMTANFQRSATISITGIALPFGLGAAASLYLYNTLMDHNETSPKFVSFCVFLGVAMSITAFPVLARILIDQQLTRTKVGIITISAAAVDDAVAWSLLALVISMLTSADNYLVALYVFLTLAAWAFFVVGIFRPLYARYVAYMTKKRSRMNFLIATTFVCVFISAYITQLLGVHAMFGGFLIGLAVPHSSEFAIKLTEKIEDFNGSVWLPLYFAYSGLNTNIKSLNNGGAWAGFFLIVTMATIGKFGGCTLASRFQGNTTWRESCTIGILMNTKGLVEVIVLNLGLSEGVINVQIFTIMILMAITTTIATTPILKLIYPLHLRTEHVSHKETELHKKEIAEENNLLDQQLSPRQVEMSKKTKTADAPSASKISTRICAPFHHQEEAYSLATFLSIFGSSSQKMVFGAYHLFELTDSYMRDNILSMVKNADHVNEADVTQFDSVLKMISVFSKLISATQVKCGLTLGNEEDFARDINSFASLMEAELILVPFYREQGTPKIAAEYEEVDYIHYVLEVANLCKKPYALFLNNRHSANSPVKSSLTQRIAVVVQDTGSNVQMFNLVQHLLAKQSTEVEVILFADEMKETAAIQEDATPRATLSLEVSELIQATRNSFKAHQSSINFHHLTKSENFKDVKEYLASEEERHPFDLILVQADARLPVGYISCSSLFGPLGECLINETKIDTPIMVVHAPPADELGHVTASKMNLLPSFLQTGELQMPYQVKVTGSKRDVLKSSSSRVKLQEMMILPSSKERLHEEEL